MYKHRSPKLDSMLGRHVLVSFCDGTFEGILEWDEEFGRYRVGDTVLRCKYFRTVTGQGLYDDMVQM